MKMVMAVAGAVLAGAGLLAGGYAAHGSTTHTKVVTVTQTVKVPEVKTNTVTITKWKTRTVISDVTPSWYQTSRDPEWGCIGNLIHQYIAAVNGGPWGDPGMFAAMCPGVALPANASGLQFFPIERPPLLRHGGRSHVSKNSAGIPAGTGIYG